VKCGTSNLPPLIASTLGSVDQTKCLTTGIFGSAYRRRGLLELSSTCFRKFVTRKTPYAPLNAVFERFRVVQVPFDDLFGELAMLVWIANQGAHLEFAAGLQARNNSASLLPRSTEQRRSASCLQVPYAVCLPFTIYQCQFY